MPLHRRVTLYFLWASAAVSATVAGSLAVIGVLYGFGAAQDLFGGQGTPTEFGATWSKPYAESLGIDWKAGYVAMLDDLGLRKVRIPVYWDEVEPSPGVQAFGDVDWQIAEASKRGAKVILSLGMRVPRWPECHIPAWAKDMEHAELLEKAREATGRAVERYRHEQAIVEWQVENESFLKFGDCPKISKEDLAAEIDVVRDLDARPVLLQDPGEFSTWMKSAPLADDLGVSLYRLVWDKHVGYVHWPGIAGAYRVRAAIAGRYVRRVINTEMQAEPWTTTPIVDMPIDEQLRQMNPKVLASNVRYARRIGFPETYFWGVEWWYWLKQQGRPEMWDAGKALIKG